MFKIDELTQDICMTRGDYGKIDITNNVRDFKTGDKVYLTLKKTITDEEYSMQIEVDTFNEDGTCTIEISPEDTAELEPSVYIYDIVWIDEDIHPTTFMEDCEIYPTFKIIKGVKNG